MERRIGVAMGEGERKGRNEIVKDVRLLMVAGLGIPSSNALDRLSSVAKSLKQNTISILLTQHKSHILDQTSQLYYFFIPC